MASLMRSLSVIGLISFGVLAIASHLTEPPAPQGDAPPSVARAELQWKLAWLTAVRDHQSRVSAAERDLLAEAVRLSREADAHGDSAASSLILQEAARVLALSGPLARGAGDESAPVVHVDPDSDPTLSRGPGAGAAPPPVLDPIQRMAVTWKEIRSEPGAVDVYHMAPKPLEAGEDDSDWARIPEQLNAPGTMILTPTGPHNGVADYRVTADGFLLVACNYDYQGNSSGGWRKDQWAREQFYAHGWREATAEDLGGVLVKSDNREQVIFVKKAAAGETGRLRCNKYDPPYFIIPAKEAAE